jgi:hypothetical protein
MTRGDVNRASSDNVRDANYFERYNNGWFLGHHINGNKTDCNELAQLLS